MRVIQGSRLGYSYTSKLGRDDVVETLKAALANAKAASEDPYYSLPQPAETYPQLDLEDPQMGEIPLEEKIEIARQMEKSGRSFHPLVKLTEQISYEELRYENAIANTEGVLLTSKGGFCGGVAAFVAGKEGDLQTGFAVDFKRRVQDLDPEAIGREAAGKAVRMIGAQRLPTKRVPVVMDPYVVVSFLGMLSSALTAEAVQKGDHFLPVR